MDWCAREYGDVVRLRLLNMSTYLLNHPDHVEYVLVRNSHNFIKSKGERHNLFFLGEGLLTSEGSFWQRQRRLVQPAFHRDRISGYGEVMVECTERMVASWQDGEVRDVHEDMTRLALEVVARTLFWALPIEEFEEAAAAITAFAQRFGRRRGVMFSSVRERIPSPFNLLRFRWTLQRLDEVIYEIIRRRRAKCEDTGSRGDLLSMLLAVQDEETGEGMSDKQLRDEVLTILMAGYDTMANSLTWIWYLLAGHPEVESRLLGELREGLAGRAPRVEDLPRLRYADMVFREALRLYPPVWAFGREAIEDCEIGGYYVPAGTQLILSPWVAHHDPRYFESPETFAPERWANDSTARLPKYAYYPFGGGRRLCIGRSFAKTEAILVLATIAQKFRLTLASEHPVALHPSITLKPKGAVKVVLTKR